MSLPTREDKKPHSSHLRDKWGERNIDGDNRKFHQKLKIHGLMYVDA